jgi:hemoglobin-like flavoprotein
MAITSAEVLLRHVVRHDAALTRRSGRNRMLTADEIELVRASFAQVVLIQDKAADLFYGRLFDIAPNLRRLFPVDMREQKRKLIQMIATAVGGLNNPDRLVPAVKALGARHAGYGVTASHYELVGEALLWTLERGLEGFTPEVRSAWANVYGVLAGTMQAGAAEVDECAPPNLSAGSLHEAVAA